MRRRGFFELLTNLFNSEDEQSIREQIDYYYKLLETETNEDMRKVYLEHINDLEIEWRDKN